MMNPVISSHIKSIKDLCRKYHFSKLWIFGSVLTSKFRPDSDIDFLYELNHTSLHGSNSIDYFFAFKDELEELLGHSVELVWYPGIRNPYFKEEVDESSVLIYDEARTKISI